MTGQFRQRVTRAIEVIRDKGTQGITVSALCLELGISPTYGRQVVKAALEQDTQLGMNTLGVLIVLPSDVKPAWH